MQTAQFSQELSQLRSESHELQSLLTSANSQLAASGDRIDDDASEIARSSKQTLKLKGVIERLQASNTSKTMVIQRLERTVKEDAVGAKELRKMHLSELTDLRNRFHEEQRMGKVRLFPSSLNPSNAAKVQYE